MRMLHSQKPISQNRHVGSHINESDAARVSTTRGVGVRAPLDVRHLLLTANGTLIPAARSAEAAVPFLRVTFLSLEYPFPSKLNVLLTRSVRRQSLTQNLLLSFAKHLRNDQFTRLAQSWRPMSAPAAPDGIAFRTSQPPNALDA